jgi:hypothetical protein
MWNDQLGKDKKKGKFCVFSLATASALVELIVRTSFVHFGQTVYHQTTGIPMGVNPGVYLANFYWFQNELRFFTQFYHIFHKFPPALQSPDGEFPNSAAVQYIDCDDEQHVLEQATPGQIGDAVLYVLYWFRFVVRFVDDIITGPNKYLKRLVNVTDSVLGGLIKGIYPSI